MPGLSGERNLYPLTIDAQGIGQVENATDLLKRDGVSDTHSLCCDPRACIL